MPIEPERFRHHWRLGNDPFPTATAEEEGTGLPPVFITPPWFADLVDDIHEPRSCIVYAEHGMGKTAHRLEVARRVKGRHDNRALVVAVDDLEALTGGNGTLHQICRLTLLQLDQMLRNDAQRLVRLKHEDRRSYDLLWLHWKQYALECAYSQPQPSPDVDILAGQVQHNDGPRATLRRLADLARALEFASVYVLFDALDEGLGPDQLAKLSEALRQLLINPGLLNNCGFAFKFFLPAALRPLLVEAQPLWPRQLTEYQISYGEDNLRAILNQRLKVASQVGPTVDDSYVTCFAQLCVPRGEDANAAALAIETALLAASNGSPRTVIQLAAAAIRAHCARASRPEEPIGWPAVEAAIERVTGRPGSPAPPPSPPPTIEPEPEPFPASLASPAEQLRFFNDGQVTIGGQFVTRLSGMLYRLMELLWNRRGNRVSYDQLVEQLYADNFDERADTRSSLVKLSRRLRKTIEPHNPRATKSRTYIDTISGIGYVLRNTGADEP